MANFPSPKFLDVTVRDGSYLLNHLVSTKKVSDIFSYLKDSNIDFAEVGHGCGIGAKMMGFPGLVDDEELLEAAKNAAPDIPLSVFISPADQSLPLIPALIDYFDLGRVGTNVDEVEKAEKIVERLKKYNKTVSIQLVRAHAKDPEFVQNSAKMAESLGADIVYLVDTFGSFTPDSVKEYIKAIRETVKIDVGFHGHNHLGLAISNTLAAWNQGANWLDASLMGVGRGPGNTQLEILLNVVQKMGFRKEINLNSLCGATRNEIFPGFTNFPRIQLRDLVYSNNKFDLTPHESLELIALFLHQPLPQVGSKLKNIMGDAVQLNDEHLKTLIQQEGYDFDQFIQTISGKSPDEHLEN